MPRISPQFNMGWKWGWKSVPTFGVPIFFLIVWLLLGLWLGVFSSPAHATILFAGGEDIDYAQNGVVTVDTGSAQHRTAFSRYALDPAAVSGSPPVNHITSPTFTATTSFWVSMQTQTSGTSTSANNEGVTLYGSDGVRRLYLRGSGLNIIKVSKRNAANTFTDLVTCNASYPTGPLEKVDWFINYAVAGQVTLYRNGVQFCNFTGDVTTDGITTLNQIEFGSFNTVFLTSFSEMIVSTTDTRSMNLFTCAPAANGTNQTWTGNQTNVNANTANDATPLTTPSNNQTAEFTCPALPAGSFSVPAVITAGRALRGTTGPQNFRFVARPSSGSTDFDSGSDIPMTTNFANYRFKWDTNPACSCAWTTNDVTTGVNFGVLSKP
jgi:hypothetical protein